MAGMNTLYKLDNAAKLFPAVTKTSNTSVYRVAAYLKETVDAARLQQALDRAIKRYPLLDIRFCSGVFWNYMMPNGKRLLVQPECEYPCAPMNYKEQNGFFVRVMYYDTRIAVEVFHSLTDGFGAVEFLKTLLYEYLTVCGKVLSGEGLVRMADSPVPSSELEDSFDRYYDPAIRPNKSKIDRAYHMEGTPHPHSGNTVIHGVYDASLINRQAKTAGMTLTQLFTSALAYAILRESSKHNASEPVVISVPVNLRKEFPSVSLKNFFCVANINAGAWKQNLSFGDVSDIVSAEFHEKMQKSHLEKVMAENHNILAHPAVRYAPLFAKNAGTKFVFDRFGESCKTITLSNLGAVRLPASMEEQIGHMDAILYPTPKSPVNCGMVSAAGKLSITFSSTIRETDMIRLFFMTVAEQTGLRAEICSNEWS